MLILRCSMAYFLYNVVMAGCTFFFPQQIATFIEAHLPVKGGWFSIVSYVLLYKTDALILSYYSQLVDFSVVFVTVLESTQVTNFAFKLSRMLKDRINFDKGVLQFPALAILTLTVLSFYWMVRLHIDRIFGQTEGQASTIVSFALITSILVMVTFSLMGRFY